MKCHRIKPGNCHANFRHSHPAYLISDRKSRYGRLENRPVRPLSAGEATGRDIAEIENLEKGGPIAIADHYIVNNGTKEDLERQVMEYIRSLD